MKEKQEKLAKKNFTIKLLRWNREQNNRQMPWKGEKDPYKIWLSEIILQQTRVEQGWDYYNRFIKTFSTIHKLAAAPDEKVMKLWEGLGYYSRCRNLLATARHISMQLKGQFPDSYETIKGLKGVGPYTAAAIASFAYNLPHAVVDGNVYRVLARVFGIHTATDSTVGKKYFAAFADELLDKQEPGMYNQAIMDFGAVVCKPAAPLCDNCIFNQQCVAFLEDKIAALPVKEKKIKIKHRWFNYLVQQYKDEWLVRQRTDKDIWQGLHEFVLLETSKKVSANVLLKQAEKKGMLQPGSYSSGEVLMLKQTLSHQIIHTTFIPIYCKRKPAVAEGLVWVKEKALKKLAFPKVINEWLDDL